MLNYLLGALLGGCMGLVSVFFAYGGLRQKKLFARLLKQKGRWHRSFLRRQYSFWADHRNPRSTGASWQGFRP